MMSAEDALGTATAERPGYAMVRVEERTTGRAFRTEQGGETVVGSRYGRASESITGDRRNRGDG